MSASREEEARRVLGRVDYYRLLSYMRPLQVRDGSGVRMFVPGTTMDDVVALYEFDRRLRLLCMDARGGDRIAPGPGRSAVRVEGGAEDAGRRIAPHRRGENGLPARLVVPPALELIAEAPGPSKII